MRPVARTLTAEELAAEAGVPVDRIEWMVHLGILDPREPGPFRFGDVFRASFLGRAAWDGRYAPRFPS